MNRLSRLIAFQLVLQKAFNLHVSKWMQSRDMMIPAVYRCAVEQIRELLRGGASANFFQRRSNSSVAPIVGQVFPHNMTSTLQQRLAVNIWRTIVKVDCKKLQTLICGPCFSHVVNCPFPCMYDAFCTHIHPIWALPATTLVASITCSITYVLITFDQHIAASIR